MGDNWYLTIRGFEICLTGHLLIVYTDFSYLNSLVRQHRLARRRQRPACCPRPEPPGQKCWGIGTDGSPLCYSSPPSPWATASRNPEASSAPWMTVWLQGGVDGRLGFRGHRGEGERSHTPWWEAKMRKDEGQCFKVPHIYSWPQCFKIITELFILSLGIGWGQALSSVLKCLCDRNVHETFS